MRPERLIVVIPVNDEEELLGRCLTAMTAAVDAVGRLPHPPRMDVVVVLDACTDGSAAIAAATPFTVVEIAARNVGIARAAGVAAALRLNERLRPHRTWLANTDADSAVPPTWLITQLQAAEAGHDLVIGTVRPDWTDLSPAQREAWLDGHSPGEANGHVHGANLGIRFDRYLAAGGFPPLAEHEDVDLVTRTRTLDGLRTLATAEGEVLTSGRSVGRTAGGYARHLRDDLVQHP